MKNEFTLVAAYQWQNKNKQQSNSHYAISRFNQIDKIE